MNHLSFEERFLIEERLNALVSVHKIALELKRPDSTVRREILRNRYHINPPEGAIQRCSNIRTCQLMHVCGDENCTSMCLRCYEVCNSYKCPEYIPEPCDRLDKSPFVCNGCKNGLSGRCKLEKYKYQARHAQIAADELLRTSRQGINLDPKEMEKLDELVSPLLTNGQSIQAIFMEHSGEIPCSERSLYNYVDWNYLSAKNIDLPRKVRFKKRNRHGGVSASRNHEPFAIQRTYTDFKEYIKDKPDISIVEMDTVIGRIGGKCLLTMFFRNCSLMVAILLDTHTQGAVIDALNDISDAIGVEVFQRLFGVILTDYAEENTMPKFFFVA